MEIFNVKDKLPDVECGSYLVYAPQSFPKNSRWVVAEYYADAKGFYSESDEVFMDDVTHWCELPQEPNNGELKANEFDNIFNWGSKELIGDVQEHFKNLEYKGRDWRSFYNGWIAGRTRMLMIIKGLKK